jgi:hypothetical protein
MLNSRNKRETVIINEISFYNNIIADKDKTDVDNK